MADLETDAQLAGAVVEEKNGEDAVRNDGLNQLGGAVEEGLQVEGGIENFSHLRQVGNIGGFHSGIGGVKMGAWVGRVGGAIVAFEVGIAGRGWGSVWHEYRME